MLKKICQYYLTEKRLLISFLSASFFVTILDLYGPVLVQNLIDTAIPQKDIHKFLIFSAALFAVYLLRLGKTERRYYFQSCNRLGKCFGSFIQRT